MSGADGDDHVGRGTLGHGGDGWVIITYGFSLDTYQLV